MSGDTVNVTGLCRRPGGCVGGPSDVLGGPVGVVLLTGTAIVPPPVSSAAGAER
jgi:hypothetical protein